MDLAARPHITAGIALASATILAAGPMAQHLPKIDTAHHLPQVSVADINLTDAASGMVDLFVGVENQLDSLASGGAAAAAVPASAIVNPFQTWINAFETAGTNLQNIYDKWSTPFPVLQQVAANWLYYGTQYVSDYQSAATKAVTYFTGTKSNQFGPMMQLAYNELTSGQISNGIDTLFEAVYSGTLNQVLTPMEKIPELLNPITANLATATKTLTTTWISNFGLDGLIGLPGEAEGGLGISLQAAYNALATGDYLGALSNLVNTPGAVVNGILNGPNYGLTTNLNTGLLYRIATYLGPQLSTAIVTPGAQPITSGGSLAVAFQTLANQLVNGWPSLSPVVNGISASLTSLLQSVPSVLSNLPSMLGNLGGMVAGQIGSWIAALLRLL